MFTRTRFTSFILILCFLVIPASVSAQDFSSQAVQNIITNQNTLVIAITFILSAIVILSAVIQLLQARTAAKTDQERNAANQEFLDRIVDQLQNERNRNATERTLMMEHMAPVKTVLEIVRATSDILHEATQQRNVLLGEFTDFLNDVTKTEPGEDLGIEYRTSDSSNPSPPPIDPGPALG